MTSGRGLLLMRAYMDDVQILVSPEGGNEIVMTKAIAGACSKDDVPRIYLPPRAA